jgi:serine/threonine protein kinase
MAAFGKSKFSLIRPPDEITSFFRESFNDIPKIKDANYTTVTDETMDRLWNTHGFKIIGSGNFGDVRLLHGSAIKQMNIEVLMRNAPVHYKDIIKNEIRTYSKISTLCSDFVCHFIGYYYNETTQQLYIQTEYCGTELFLMYAESVQSPKIVRNHIGQILRIVQCLHNNRIAHRDLKLENFTIDESGKIRVIDFGTCVDLNEDHGKTINRAGTHLYLAPEFVDTRKITITSELFAGDIYSLGIMFLQMVGDREPYIYDLNEEKFNNTSLIYRITSLGKEKGEQYISGLWADFESKMKTIFGNTFSARDFFDVSDKRKTIDELVALFNVTQNSLPRGGKKSRRNKMSRHKKTRGQKNYMRK